MTVDKVPRSFIEMIYVIYNLVTDLVIYVVTQGCLVTYK